ncbi:MAG: cytochrome C [Nitrospirae bacterium]|nr:cytochrome C [Nitrospirota bacterium]
MKKLKKGNEVKEVKKVQQVKKFKKGNKAAFLTFLTFFSFLTFYLPFFNFSSYAVPSHLDKSKGSAGCGTCHRGHGMRGTPLLQNTKDNLCLTCHGGAGKAKDVYSVIVKPSNHPIIQTSRYHVTGETLPEIDNSLPRHASCYDCHNTHRSEKGKAVEGMKGYSGRGAPIRQINSEYQLCYACHSDSANLPPEKNIAADFSPANASFHPVETYGKNSFVPSLKREYTASSIIKCTDCHGNDDPSGPEGPHGSIYAPILKDRYESVSGPESPSTYALCYQCHNRTSILNDESFKAHKAHVVFNQTSCAFCHNAHGSSIYASLLNFDINSVFPNETGELSFMSAVPGKPRCFLSCHIDGKTFDHTLGGSSPSDMSRRQSLQYCVNDRCVPGW